MYLAFFILDILKFINITNFKGYRNIPNFLPNFLLPFQDSNILNSAVIRETER